MFQFFAPLSATAVSHWVDDILLCILLFYAIEGFIVGGIVATFDLIKFVTSFFAGFLLYSSIGRLLSFIFHIPKGYANALGFFLGAFLAELILHILLRHPVRKVHEYILSQGGIWKKMNTILGIFPGALSGAVLVMFIVTICTALPLSPFFKQAVHESTLGSFFGARSQVLQKSIAGVFGGAAEETLNFLTVEPQSNQSVSLDFTTANGIVDIASEGQMLDAVNNERTKRSISPLTMDTKLQQLARAYAQEMLSRGYFSHYTPEGLSPFDRMNKAGIVFNYAGENLAFSQDEALAMQGLMNSTGHRENILSPNYHKVGIGVIDAGIYGEMFVQEFTN